MVSWPVPRYVNISGRKRGCRKCETPHFHQTYWHKKDKAVVKAGWQENWLSILGRKKTRRSKTQQEYGSPHTTKVEN